ncbi:ribosome silencing factor [Alphaproteobacteria bacterium]|nr:ribosome silencing factor [Alphaproteobacteria bacterium]
MSPSDLKNLVEQSLDADKAFDIVTIDLDDQTGVADYMIIASGTSSRHVAALAGKLKDKMLALQIKGVKVEGLGQSDWVVLDAGDIIVHLFRPEVREFYNMERMWGMGQNLHVVEQQHVSI